MTDVHADPLEQLRTRTSEKWTSFPPHVLPLFVAEMDYPLAPVVARAMIERIEASDSGYVGSPGALGPAFAGYAQRSWGWSVDPKHVRTATDVSVAIVETFRLLIEPEDGIVITPPVYPPFFDLVAEAGGALVEVPLIDDGSAWSLDLDGLDAAFAAGAKVFLLCSPHNPLGLVHSVETLRAVAELADRHGVIVVSDEIHAPLTHPGTRFVPYPTVSDAARDHSIVVTSASKAWNLAGIKCALIVAGGERMSRVLAALPEEVGFRTGILGLHGSVAAYDHGQDWLNGALAAITANRDLLASLLAEHLPGVGYRMPRASYLAWLDFRALDWGDDPSILALQRGVALNPGPTFGAPGQGHARLNFACSPEVLTEAIHRLART